MEIEKNHFLLFSSFVQSVLFISYLNSVFKSDQFVIFKLLTKHVVHIFSYVPMALRNFNDQTKLVLSDQECNFFLWLVMEVIKLDYPPLPIEAVRFCCEKYFLNYFNCFDKFDQEFLLYGRFFLENRV